MQEVRERKKAAQIREYAAYSVLLSIIVLTIMGVLIHYNGYHRTITEDSRVSAEDLETWVYRIGEIETDSSTGHICLNIDVEGRLDVEQLAIAAFRTKSMTWYDGAGGSQEVLDADHYQHVSLLPLQEYQYREDTGVLHLEWTAEDFFNPCYFFIGSASEMNEQNAFWNQVRDLSLGMMILMLLYSISLFVYKREETYLLSFSVYIGLTFFMTLLNAGPVSNDWIYQVYHNTVPFLIMLILCMEVFTCIHLTGVEGCPWSRPFRSAKGMLVIGIAYYIISQIGSMFWKEVSRVTVILIGFSVVICACAQHKRKALMLLVGYAVSEGINLIPVGINLGFFQDGLGLAYFRMARLYDIPFAFCCMFFINWKFASRFKEAEALSAELERTNRSLDQIVQERTEACVQQMEQRHSMMMNIFHDIRSPLFTLRGCLDILSDETEESLEERKEIVAIASERLDFMSGLAENLFLLAKLEDDSFFFTCTRVNLTELLKNLLAGCQIGAERKEITVQEEIPDAPVWVWGDRQRLEQAIDNILNNAVRYTPEEGCITVRMSCEKDRAAVSIRDTGIGIAKDALPYIFDRYYRASDKSRNATGLGLAIARGLIQKQGGTIAVESEEGKGTVFIITLPVLQENRSQDES